MYEQPKTKYTPVRRIGTPVIHPHRENVAFGKLVLPVLSRQLRSEDVELKKRSLRTLCDQLYEPEKVASAMFLCLVPTLLKLADHPDAGVRQLLAECLSVLSMGAVGRKELVDTGLHRVCFQLVDDVNHVTRYHASKALYHMSLSPFAVNSLISSGLIHRLLPRLPMESLVVQKNLLHVLHACYVKVPHQAVEQGVAKTLPRILRSPCPRVRERAATVFMDLCSVRDGQAQALEADVIPVLLEMCVDDDPEVRAKSLAAVMMIANCTPGKLKLVDNEAVQKLLPLLDDEETQVCVNCLQVLTALAEVPGAKPRLLENVSKFLVLNFHRDDQVRRAARRAARLIMPEP